MTEKTISSVSEAAIAVHWQEEKCFPPASSFIAQANMTDPGILNVSAWTTSANPEVVEEVKKMVQGDEEVNDYFG